MSHDRQFILFADRRRYSVVGIDGVIRAAIDADSVATGATTASLLLDAMRAAGCAPGEVIVALASELCLAASIQTAGLPRARRSRAMLYRLEEKLPLAAEELLADFAIHDGRALGVAARTQELQPLFDALESVKIRIAAVLPSVLLATQGLALRQPGMRDKCDAILWHTDRKVDLLALEDRQPTRWLSVSAERADVALALATWTLSSQSPLRLARIGLDDALDLDSIPDVQIVERHQLRMQEAALAASEEIFSRRLAPVVDLRRAGPGKYRPPLQLWRAVHALAGAIVAFCLALGATDVIRGVRYAAQARRADADKKALFQDLFPGQPVPPGIESRLQSVARNLRTPGVALASGPSDPDPLLVLLEVLAHLPSDVRFRVTDLEISPGRAQLIGSVRSHADAVVLTTALRATPRLAVDEPQTQQMPDGAVQFTLSMTTRSSHQTRGDYTR